MEAAKSSLVATTIIMKLITYNSNKNDLPKRIDTRYIIKFTLSLVAWLCTRYRYSSSRILAWPKIAIKFVYFQCDLRRIPYSFWCHVNKSNIALTIESFRHSNASPKNYHCLCSTRIIIVRYGVICRKRLSVPETCFGRGVTRVPRALCLHGCRIGCYAK